MFFLLLMTKKDEVHQVRDANGGMIFFEENRIICPRCCSILTVGRKINGD